MSLQGIILFVLNFIIIMLPLILIGGSIYFFRKKRKIIASVLLIIGISLGLVIVRIFVNTYQPSSLHCNEKGEICTTKEKSCLCIGGLMVLESYPAKYHCSGFNFCRKINETSCHESFQCIVDISKCDDFDDKNHCIAQVARNLEDETVCSQINEQEARESCIVFVAKLKNDPDICNKVSYKSKVNCITHFVRYSGAVSLCNDYLDEENKTDDYYDCFSAPAYSLRNPTYCNNINDTQIRASCEKSAWDELNRKFSFEISSYESGYLSTPCINTGNSDGYWEYVCLTRFADYYDDTSFCDMLVSEDNKQLCLENMDSGSGTCSGSDSEFRECIVNMYPNGVV